METFRFGEKTCIFVRQMWANWRDFDKFTQKTLKSRLFVCCHHDAASGEWKRIHNIYTSTRQLQQYRMIFVVLLRRRTFRILRSSSDINDHWWWKKKKSACWCAKGTWVRNIRRHVCSVFLILFLRYFCQWQPWRPRANTRCFPFPPFPLVNINNTNESREAQ